MAARLFALRLSLRCSGQDGADNLALYSAFADPMNTPGLMLAPSMKEGFRFVIMDVSYTEGDRIIELNAPEDLYDIAALLRDPALCDRVDLVAHQRRAGRRLHLSAAQYRRQVAGKDDPVMLVRVQKMFPATGEIVALYALVLFVAGSMRGSHQIPLMPVKLNSGISYFDGPPVVSCAAFAMHAGRMTGAVDVFAHPFWDKIRDTVSEKAVSMRRQGFFGAAMLPMSEWNTGIVEKLDELEGRFSARRSTS